MSTGSEAFDLRATDGTVRRREYRSPIPASEPKEARAVAGNRLDSADFAELHSRLISHYTRELDRQYRNRIEMGLDADYYDNDQWSEEDRATLEERGQVPIVYNVISASVDWVTGSERRARTDFKVVPRRKDGSKPAERKRQLLKYLADVNRTQFSISRAFEDEVKVGLGWIEDGVTDDFDREPIYCRYESWRNILHDSSATELDLSDARYIFRTKWVDLDVAIAMFPKRRFMIEQSVDNANDQIVGDYFGDAAMDSQEIALEQSTRGSRSEDVLNGHARQRVRLIECWYTQPVSMRKIIGGQFSGEVYDPNSAGHNRDIEDGEAEVRERVSSRMHVAIMTHRGLIYSGPSPYRHNRYPFTPLWGYRRDRDNLPYGLIRRLRDIQNDVNKRASKALHILSTNKVIMDRGAVKDVDELAEELARPDSVIEVEKGHRFEISADRDLSQWHLEMMSRSIAMIQQASGVTDELLGRKTNAGSGIAIERRQQQGALATERFFDHLRLAKQISGEKQISLIEQFMHDRKQFRITNMRGTPEYIDINDGLPENDIIRTKADFLITDSDWRASIRQAQADELMALVGQLAPVAPAVVMVMLDLIVESMDLHNRDELVNRIRAVTGMRDPDAEEPTPEEQQRAQAQAAAQELQMQMAMAELRKKAAEAQRAEAQAAQIGSRTVTDAVDAQHKAITTAQAALQMPAATQVADHILAESGFISRSDKEEAMAAEAAAAEAAAQEQAAAQELQMQQAQAAGQTGNQPPQQPENPGELRNTPPAQGEPVGLSLD